MHTGLESFSIDIMRPRRFTCIGMVAPMLVLAASHCHAATGPASPKGRPTIFEATLGEPGQRSPELSTRQLQAFLARRSGIVLDARSPREFALAHIPGSISIEETGLLRVVQEFPDRGTEFVVYAGGPATDQATRRAEDLMNLGYARVSRYQLGLAVWRALGNATETTVPGLRRILAERNAVVVDARSRAEYLAGTIPAAENVQAGEVARAIQDRRLQYYDQGTRIVVFGDSAGQAREVAEEIARNAFTNSSYVGGTYQELKRSGAFSERKPSLSYPGGRSR